MQSSEEELPGAPAASNTASASCTSNVEKSEESQRVSANKCLPKCGSEFGLSCKLNPASNVANFRSKFESGSRTGLADTNKLPSESDHCNETQSTVSPDKCLPEFQSSPKMDEIRTTSKTDSSHQTQGIEAANLISTYSANEAWKKALSTSSGLKNLIARFLPKKMDSEKEKPTLNSISGCAFPTPSKAPQDSNEISSPQSISPSSSQPPPCVSKMASPSSVTACVSSSCSLTTSHTTSNLQPSNSAVSNLETLSSNLKSSDLPCASTCNSEVSAMEPSLCKPVLTSAHLLSQSKVQGSLPSAGCSINSDPLANVSVSEASYDQSKPKCVSSLASSSNTFSAPSKTAEILPFKALLSSSNTHSLPVNRVAPLQSVVPRSTSNSKPIFTEGRSSRINTLENNADTYTPTLESIPAEKCEMTNVNVDKPSTSHQMNESIIGEGITNESSSCPSSNQPSTATSVLFRSLSSLRTNLDKKQKYRGIVVVGDERFSNLKWPSMLPKGKCPLYILSRHGASLQTLSGILSGSTASQLMTAPGSHHWQQLLIVCTVGWRDLLQVTEEKVTGGVRKQVSLRHPESVFVSSVMRDVVSAHATLNALVPDNKAHVIFAHVLPVNVKLLYAYLNKRYFQMVLKKEYGNTPYLSKFLANAVVQINTELDAALLSVGSPLTPYQHKCPHLLWRFTPSDDNLVNGIIPSRRHLREIFPVLLNLYSSYVFQTSCKTPFHQLYIIGDSRLSALAARWPSNSEVSPIFLLSDDITPHNVIDVINFYCRKTDAIIFAPSTEKLLLEDVPYGECTGHAPFLIPSFLKKMAEVDRSVSSLMQVLVEMRESEFLKTLTLIFSPLLPFDLMEKFDSVAFDHISEFEHRPHKRVKESASSQQDQMVKYLDKLGTRLEEACVFANAPFTDAFCSMSSSSAFSCENGSRDIVRAILDTLQMNKLTLSKSKPVSSPDSADHEVGVLDIHVKVIDVSKRPSKVHHRFSSEVKPTLQPSDDESTLNPKPDHRQWRSRSPLGSSGLQMRLKNDIDELYYDERPSCDSSSKVLDYADELLQFRAEYSSLRKQKTAGDDVTESIPQMSPLSSCNSSRSFSALAVGTTPKRRCARGLSESPDGEHSVSVFRRLNHSSKVEKKPLLDTPCADESSIQKLIGPSFSSRTSRDEVDNFNELKKNFGCSSTTRSKSKRSTSPHWSMSPNFSRSCSKFDNFDSSNQSHSSRNVFSDQTRSSQVKSSCQPSCHSRRSLELRSPSRQTRSHRRRESSSRSHSSRRSHCSRRSQDLPSRNRDLKVSARKSSKKAKRRRSTSSSSSSSSSSSRKYRSSRGKNHQKKKKKKKKKKKIKNTDKTRELVSSSSYEESPSSVAKSSPSNVEDLQAAYRRGLERYLSREPPHPLYNSELATFLASEEINCLMEVGVSPDHIRECWKKIWDQKVSLFEQEKSPEKQFKSDSSILLDESQDVKNESRGISASTTHDTTVNLASDENIDEVGEDLDIDCLLTTKKKSQPLKRSVSCSTKVVVRSVLQMVSLFKDTIGVLADALPLLLIKCTEMEKSGLNPLTAFGPEEVTVLSLMLTSIEAQAVGSSSLPCREEIVREACVRELSRLLSAIEKHQTLDLTSLAIETLNFKRNDALLRVAERLMKIGSTEPALSVYNSILEDQSAMTAFIAQNSQAFDGSEVLSSS